MQKTILVFEVISEEPLTQFDLARISRDATAEISNLISEDSASFDVEFMGHEVKVSRA